MANPRQRRKSKSSSYKPVSHSKRAKKMLKKMPAIRGPKVLQDAWDKSKTVRQNYEALGLAHSLNPMQSGGSEHQLTYTRAQAGGSHHVSEDAAIDAAPESTSNPVNASAGPSITQPNSSTEPSIPKGFGRIVRDASGNVIGVEMGDDADTEKVMPGTEPSGRMDVDSLPEAQADREVLETWVEGLACSQRKDADDPSRNSSGVKKSDNSVVTALEELSSTATAVPRHASHAEMLYLSRLVQKFCSGENGGTAEEYEKMARDRLLNPDQRTAGELKRAIKKAGGVASLRQASR